ncbi:MAG TPA: LysR family transcriptional regulator [Trebonia sp.]
MDAHLLRTFVTVARLGSFSAAANELRYTQAAVSQQVAALENDLKVTLLRRRPVEPTEAGARLLEHAVPILLRMDAARADVTRMTAPPAARLACAMTPLGGAASVVAARLAELRAQMPRLDVTIRVASREEVAEATARGDADLGLIDGLAAPNDPLSLSAPLSAIGIAESPAVVIAPADHPLAAGAARWPRLADLADARWIDAPGVAPSLADLRRASGTDGFRAALRYDGTDIVTLLRLAADGHGLTVLPATLFPATPLLPLTAHEQFRSQSSFGTAVAIRISAPRLVYRVELIHGTLPGDSPAAALAGLFSPGLP